MTDDLAFSLVAEPILTGATTAKLIIAVGALKEGVARETLEIGVHNAALAFAMHRGPIDPQERVSDAEALADACRMVLVRLGLAVESRRKDKSARKPIAWRSLRRSLGAGALYTGGASVLTTIAAIQELEGMAERIANHYADPAKQRGKDRGGAPKNAALGPLFRDLEELYFELWDDMPALARSSVRGNWREAEQAEGVVAEAYETGGEIPVRFLRFLSELFPLFAERGMDVPTSSAAIEQACRRWRKEQRGLAQQGRGDESLYDLGRRLAREIKGH